MNEDLELQKSMDNVEKFLEDEKLHEQSPIVDGAPTEDTQEVEEDAPLEEVHQEESKSLDIDDDLQRQILAKKKLSKLTRERHRLAAETQKLKEENQALRNHMEHSSQAAMTHYDNNVQLRIDTAKKEKLKALEIGDMEAVVERDQELAEAVAELKNIQSWKTQESIRQYSQQQEAQQYQQQQQYYEPPEVELNEETETWIEANPWFDPNSREHIPEVFEDVNDYIASLDEHLARTGKDHQRFTKAYFNKIDAYVNDTYGRQAPITPAPMKMKSSNQYIEPVRNKSSVAAPPRKQQVIITPEEERMLPAYGVTKEQYIKEKILDIEKQKMKGKSNGYR